MRCSALRRTGCCTERPDPYGVSNLIPLRSANVLLAGMIGDVRQPQTAEIKSYSHVRPQLLEIARLRPYFMRVKRKHPPQAQNLAKSHISLALRSNVMISEAKILIFILLSIYYPCYYSDWRIEKRAHETNYTKLHRDKRELWMGRADQLLKDLRVSFWYGSRYVMAALVEQRRS